MMDETLSSTPSDNAASSGGSSLILWLAACAVATVGMSLIAAHAPPRVRLIGLFSIAFGSIIGSILPRLARLLDSHPSPRQAGIAASLLTIAGLIGCTWETARLDESRVPAPKTGNDAIAARLIEQLKRETGADPAAPGLNGMEIREPSSFTRFRSHLSHRLQQLGNLSSPWPEGIWCLELLMAAMASAIVSTRMTAVPG